MPSRPVERIDLMLAELRAAWLRYPDMRLGQLIANACRADATPEEPSGRVRDVFYVQDDEVWDALKRIAAGAYDESASPAALKRLDEMLGRFDP